MLRIIVGLYLFARVLAGYPAGWVARFERWLGRLPLITGFAVIGSILLIVWAVGVTAVIKLIGVGG